MGDLPDVSIDRSVRAGSVCDNLPNVIDDVFICASVEAIDGRGGTLAAAIPEYLRTRGNLPVTGRMLFDSADADELVPTL